MRIQTIKNSTSFRYISWLLIVLLLFSVTGCAGQGDSVRDGADRPDAAMLDTAETVPDIILPPDLPDMQFIVSPKYVSAETPNAQRIQSFCLSPDGSVFASMTAGEIVKFDIQGNVVKSYPAQTALFNIVMLGNTLYGYSYGESASIVALQTETGEVESFPITYQADQVRAMAGYAGKLLLLCAPVGSRDNATELVWYDLADASHSVSYLTDASHATANADTVMALSALGGGRVLLYGFDGKNYLMEMDMQSMGTGKKTYLDTLGVAGAVVQNQASGDLFFGSRDSAGISGVFADAPGKPAVVLEEVAPRGGNDLQFRDGYLFVLDSNTGILHRHTPVPPEKEAITLQIDQSFSFAYGTQRTVPGLSDWTRAYRTQTGNSANVRARFTNWDQFVAELASGSDHIDAFVISFERAYSNGLFDQGAYHPLTGESFESFYEQAFDWVSDELTLGDGSYWALPVYLDSEKIYYTPSKFAAYGLDVSLFDSFDSIIETAEMLKDKRRNGLCNVEITGTLSISYSQPYQYFATMDRDNTTFDTPEFRSAMHTLKRFYDFPNEVNWDDYLFRIIAPFAPTMHDVVFMMSSDDKAWGNAVWSTNPRDSELAAYEKMLALPLPKLNDDPDMPAIMDMDVLIINPNSKNKEEVLCFAECVAEALLSPVRADASAPQIPMLFENKDVYQNVYNVNSAQFESLYEYYSNGAVPTMPYDVIMYLYEYGIGEATEDDTIFAIERYMEMRLKEGP